MYWAVSRKDTPFTHPILSVMIRMLSILNPHPLSTLLYRFPPCYPRDGTPDEVILKSWTELLGVTSGGLPSMAVFTTFYSIKLFFDRSDILSKIAHSIE
jgi:hypothetical protein